MNDPADLTMREPLFRVGPWRCIELLPADAPLLQRFFEDNPEYFLAVGGQAPRLDEAQQEFEDLPPAHLGWRRRWMLGFLDVDGALAGMASVLSDLMAEGIGHIGLFIVATRLHGQGAAQALHAALERWMAADGARWLRLGVVIGNGRAEAFWTRLGYRETRQRAGIAMADRSNTVRVMVKPLAGGTLDEYLALAPRDRPDSALP